MMAGQATCEVERLLVGFGYAGGLAAAYRGSEETRWGSSLPADLQCAAPGIDRDIRGVGSTSVRDWIAQRCQSSRGSPVWVDLWTLATSVDFRLRECKTDLEIMQVLSAEDMMVALRRLAACVHEERSGDRVGAQYMLGTAPPGCSAEVAPARMVASANTHSKTERPRCERVESELRARKKKKKKKKKEGEKGDGRGRGRGREDVEVAGEVVSASPIDEPLLPITLAERPKATTSRSSHLRHRHQRRLWLWALANELARGINFVDAGSCTVLTRLRRWSSSSENIRSLRGQARKDWQRRAEISI
ncbi:unnamed protein product [Prorocentrum cordatum]|uniref:Uncharacterized protein n=1 Tax=Prorocentrum cordatum TaxID=2364126 RepID=A0ABN9VAN8_9DINO|nr:unnamed protein product [Polarella glacialis]